MTINNTINYFEDIKTKTVKKSEIKVYTQFIITLKKLEKRGFSNEEIQSIEDELERLNLKSNPENRKKYFKKAHKDLERFLKDTFSLTSEGYYTNKSVGLGILFGVVFGILLGEGFEKSLGLALGICMGLLVGAFIGKRKDAQAKATGNLL